jgi:hypothetical protein
MLTSIAAVPASAYCCQREQRGTTSLCWVESCSTGRGSGLTDPVVCDQASGCARTDPASNGGLMPTCMRIAKRGRAT